MIFRLFKLATTLLLLVFFTLILKDCTQRDAALEEINKVQPGAWRVKR